jgi:hypothetical protein
MTVSDWRRPDGTPSTLGELPFVEEELAPPGAFQDLAPDEDHFQEATGNEGASFQRSYRRAAFVLWPHDRFFAVLNQAGLSVTLPFLGGSRRALGGEWRGCRVSPVEAGRRAVGAHDFRLAGVGAL